MQAGQHRIRSIKERKELHLNYPCILSAWHAVRSSVCIYRKNGYLDKRRTRTCHLSKSPSSSLSFHYLLSEPFPRKELCVLDLTLNHYLHELGLEFHLHIKVFGVVTSNLKCYLTVFFHVNPNEILPLNSEDSKQSRLKFYASAEMSALMH